MLNAATHGCFQAITVDCNSNLVRLPTLRSVFIPHKLTDVYMITKIYESSKVCMSTTLALSRVFPVQKKCACAARKLSSHAAKFHGGPIWQQGY